MNSAKMIFGNIYLSITRVYTLTGFVGGYLLYTVVGSLNMYTMFLMIELAERYPLTHSLSEIAEEVGGKWGKIVVNVSLWRMQCIIYCGYLFIIA